jgi:hypothetical protein
MLKKTSTTPGADNNIRTMSSKDQDQDHLRASSGRLYMDEENEEEKGQNEESPVLWLYRRVILKLLNKCPLMTD